MKPKDIGIKLTFLAKFFSIGKCLISSLANVEHYILSKHLMDFINFFVRVCVPKISGDCRTGGPTFFLPPLSQMICITCCYLFYKMCVSLSKQLKMRTINMNLRKNNPIHFIIFNQTFFSK